MGTVTIPLGWPSVHHRRRIRDRGHKTFTITIVVAFPHPRRRVPVPHWYTAIVNDYIVSFSNVHEVEVTASNKAQVPPVGITFTYHHLGGEGCRCPLFFFLFLFGRSPIGASSALIRQPVAGGRSTVLGAPSLRPTESLGKPTVYVSHVFIVPP
jgi:hypothetical protein